MLTTRRTTILLTLLGIAILTAPSRAEAPLETETARFSPRGTLEVGGSYEVQHSVDGRETALPLSFEYFFSRRLALMAEPVPMTRIQPTTGTGASGAGDLEITLNGLIRAESGRMPAFAIAGEIKVPTSESSLIGSDQYDYAGYFVASKRYGDLDLHANLGYTVVGRPPGVTLNNTWNYALAGEYALGQRWTMVGEVLGNTSAIPEAGSGESVSTPEISGGESIAMLGARWRWTSNLNASFGVTLDNTGAVLVRPGLTARF